MPKKRAQKKKTSPLGPSPREIEFKYSADKMDTTEFVTRAGALTEVQPLVTRGIDYFYSDAKKADMFFRHRIGQDMNQLTLKKKLTKDNNYIRIEHNINLNKDAHTSDVEQLLKDLGFTYNMFLQKRAWIFKTKLYTLVLYVVYRDTTHSGYTYLGKFIEIEMAEDVVWKSETEAYKELCKLERKFKGLGISPKRRLKKSLWEMYKKVDLL